MNTERHVLRRFGLPVLLVTAVLGLAACGDDDEDTTAASDDATTEEAASTESIDLTATEYDFELSATPTADTTTINATNDGKDFHVMIFAKINEGFTTEEAIKLEGEKGSAEMIAEAELPPGETVEAEVKGPLSPGEYAMLCPIGGPEGAHYELGQLEEFSIE